MNSQATNQDVLDAVSELGEAVQTLATTMDRRFDEQDAKMATKEDLKAFAKKDDLKRFATKDDLKAFAKKDDLARLEEKMATKDDLKGVEHRLTRKIRESEFNIRGEIKDVEDEFQTDFKKLNRRVATRKN